MSPVQTILPTFPRQIPSPDERHLGVIHLKSLAIIEFRFVHSTMKTFSTFLSFRYYRWICFIILLLVFSLTPSQATAEEGLVSSGASSSGHFLYVATPGIRDYLGYGGHGLLVFDIDDQHRFVRRIPTQGFHKDGRPANVKGIAVSAQLNSIFISTLYSLQRIDLATDQLLWERAYQGGCDRMSISPDGKTMYLPSLEKDFWNVVACEDG